VAKGIEAKKDSKFVKEWTRNESAGYVDERDRKVKDQKRKEIYNEEKKWTDSQQRTYKAFFAVARDTCTGRVVTTTSLLERLVLAGHELIGFRVCVQLIAPVMALVHACFMGGN